MASSAEVIVLSSSPNPLPQTPTRAVHTTEKSFDHSPLGGPTDSIPSPSELFPSRSRFFPTPSAANDATKRKARVTKKSAASVSRDETTTSKPKSKVAAKRPRKDAATTAETVTQDTTDAGVKKSKAAPKSRAKTTNKKKETGNMKITGKVTKGGSDSQPQKSGKGKKKTTPTNEDPISQEGNEAIVEDGNLRLDEALRRRMDWTPPRETSKELESKTTDGETTIKSPGSGSAGGFDQLLSIYNYSGAPVVPGAPQNMSGEGPTKRRRIELVDPLLQPFQVYQANLNEDQLAQEEDQSMLDPQPKKKAKRPKRLTTLTARMTAQHTLDSPNDNSSASDESQVTRKTKLRGGKGKKSENDTTPILVSPEAAFRSLEDQDLVFGTFSQLEREDSPQMLGEMQNAIRASESLHFDEKRMAVTEKAIAKVPVSYTTGTRNLWQVAARSTDGSLVQAKKADEVISARSAAVSNTQKPKAKRPVNWEDDDWFDLDYGKPQPSPKKTTPLPEKSSKPLVKPKPLDDVESDLSTDKATTKTTIQEDMTQQPQMPHYSGFTDAELTKQISAFGFKSVRGRKKMIELLQKCWESKHGSSQQGVLAKAQPPTQVDDLKLPSSSQAENSHIATQTGSQKATTRPKTQSKKKATTAQSTYSNPLHKAAQKDTTTSSVTKKAPQKAAKYSQGLSQSYIDVEEIQDSEDESTPSPSQVQKRYKEIFSNTSESSLEIRTKELTTSPTKRKSATAKSAGTAKSSLCTSDKPQKVASSKRSSLPDLSSQITKAVRSQHKLSPLSSSLGSRSRPTWHEKILMYDPVILEDFTIWLNVEGLGLVGEDREIHAAMAREWCESLGICCCWKNGAGW